MHSRLLWTPFLLAVLACSLNVRGEEQGKLNSIRWLLGDWTETTEKSIRTESWTDSRGVFVGQGAVRSKSDNRTRSSESLLLVEMSGEVFYIAKVQENEFPVPFKLIDSSAMHAIFENNGHDFPKRLEYRLENGKLNVKVGDGQKRFFVLSFSKVESPKPK